MVCMSASDESTPTPGESSDNDGVNSADTRAETAPGGATAKDWWEAARPHTWFNAAAPVMEPLEILGGASIPMILMSFGASLRGGGVLAEGPDRPATITASALKLTFMPAAAWVLGLLAGLDGTALYAAVILSALPTAQNVYNYTANYRAGETVARDTVFITTFASLPAMIAIALLFGKGF